MKKYKDLYTGLVVFFLSLFYLVNVSTIRVFTGAGATAINARTVPAVEGGLLMFLSLAMIVRFWVRMRRGEITKGDGKAAAAAKAPFRVRMAVPLTLLLLLLYVLAIGKLGFVITSMAYLFLQVLILSPEGKLNFIAAAIIAVVCPVVIYLLFVYLLNVPLPSGIMPF